MHRAFKRRIGRLLTLPEHRERRKSKTRTDGLNFLENLQWKKQRDWRNSSIRLISHPCAVEWLTRSSQFLHINLQCFVTSVDLCLRFAHKFNVFSGSHNTCKFAVTSNSIYSRIRTQFVLWFWVTSLFGWDAVLMISTRGRLSIWLTSNSLW